MAMLELVQTRPDWMNALGMDGIAAHAASMTCRLLDALRNVRHGDDSPAVAIYGPVDHTDRGGTVAFNLLDRQGRALPYDVVETALSDQGVYVRGGCFCNPGASEAAFRFDPAKTSACLGAIEDSFSVARFAACLGPEAVVGALRASVGVPTNVHDIDRLVAAVKTLL